MFVLRPKYTDASVHFFIVFFLQYSVVCRSAMLSSSDFRNPARLMKYDLLSFTLFEVMVGAVIVLQ